MIKLDRNEETIYRQYARELKHLQGLIVNELKRYESGEAMTGELTSIAAEVIKHGGRVSLLYDFLESES